MLFSGRWSWAWRGGERLNRELSDVQKLDRQCGYTGEKAVVFVQSAYGAEWDGQDGQSIWYHDGCKGNTSMGQRQHEG